MNYKKTVNKLVGVICAGLLLTPFISSAHENEQVEEKILKLSIGSIKQFEIEAGAGSIKLIGNDSDEIVVTAKITKGSDTDYELSLEEKRGRAYLIAKNDANYFNKQHHFRIDLEISVPSILTIDLTDGSGDISIRNMLSNVKIKDGSGSIHVQETKGSVEIKDGSGDIRLSNVGGKVEINDGSGSITTKNLSDDLDISDGSGDINVEQVTGSVVIHDGSGSINVDTVGNFRLLQDGSGDLDVTNVTGEVDLGKHKRK